MAPQTGTAILVIVVFVLPGFVALRYAEQTYRTRAEDSALERLLTALYFSLLSYLVIALGAWAVLEIDTTAIRELWRGEKPFRSYVGLTLAGLIVPLAIAECARRWSSSRARSWMLARARINTAHNTPSGWEHFFLQDRWAYVRATLKDGRVVAGFYGPSSFAGYTAETPDLYLEHRYALSPDTDWFDGKVEGTLGIYIRADEIVSVEFYDAGSPPPNPPLWRRLWSRLRGDADEPETTSDADGPAGPEEGRHLAVRQTGAASEPSPSGSA